MPNCELCSTKLLNPKLKRCGKCTRTCERCSGKLHSLNYGQLCARCSAGGFGLTSADFDLGTTMFAWELGDLGSL